MECLWCLFSHWQPDGYRNQPDPPILYVCLDPYDGFPHHSLHDPCFLEKYPEVYLGRPAESLVLFVNSVNGEWSIVKSTIDYCASSPIAIG